MNLIDVLGPVESSTPEPFTPHTALLWGRDDLLIQAVSAYLEKMSWKVIQVANDGNDERLLAELQRVSPEVVILCQYKEGDDAVLPLRLIHDQLCLKVVTIGMDSNLLHIYCKRDIVLKGAADLLSIMESGQYTSCVPRKEVGTLKQKD